MADAPAASPNSTAGASPADAVRQFQQAIGQGDWDAAAQVLAPDVVFHEAPTLPFGGDHHGVDGYRKLADTFAGLADFEFSPMMELLTTDQGVVVVRGAFTVTGKATGRSATTPFAEFYLVKDGLIADVDVFYWDEAAVIDALVEEAK